MSGIKEKLKTLQDLIMAELKFVGNWTKVANDSKHDKYGYFAIKHSRECIFESIDYIKKMLPYLNMATRLGENGSEQHAESAIHMSKFITQTMTNITKLISDTMRRISNGGDVFDQMVSLYDFSPGMMMGIQDELMNIQSDVLSISEGTYKSNVDEKELPSLDSVLHVMKTSLVNTKKGMKLFESCVSEHIEDKDNTQQVSR